jgi:ribonuclease HI
MIFCYTDGSANWKNGLGGYGVYINDEGEEYFYSEGFSNTKTGRMELTAMLTCLRKIKQKNQPVTIFSDSMYVVNCFDKNWLINWERFLWNGPKNVDLLKQLLEEYRKFSPKPIIQHIKGHTDKDDIHSLGNSIADKLANYRQFKSYKIDQHEEVVL